MKIFQVSVVLNNFWGGKGEGGGCSNGLNRHFSFHLSPICRSNMRGGGGELKIKAIALI